MEMSADFGRLQSNSRYVVLHVVLHDNSATVFAIPQRQLLAVFWRQKIIKTLSWSPCHHQNCSCHHRIITSDRLHCLPGQEIALCQCNSICRADRLRIPQNQRWGHSDFLRYSKPIQRRCGSNQVFLRRSLTFADLQRPSIQNALVARLPDWTLHVGIWSKLQDCQLNWNRCRIKWTLCQIEKELSRSRIDAKSSEVCAEWRHQYRTSQHQQTSKPNH